MDSRDHNLTQTLQLHSEHLFDTAIPVLEPLQLGDIPKGNRRIRVAQEGEFSGKRLCGKILSGGTNWLLVRPDGVAELDVRLNLEASDGALIHMRSEGFLHFPPESAKQVLAGRADPSEYYLRERTVFETAAEAYYWLNSIVAVGVGWYRPGLVGMSIYEIK